MVSGAPERISGAKSNHPVFAQLDYKHKVAPLRSPGCCGRNDRAKASRFPGLLPLRSASFLCRP